jgi:Rrf2 family protein
MFSKSCEYAIKAMIYIARESGEDNKVGVKDIAKGTNSPEHFIAKILQELGRKKLLQSTKGPNGGFYMDAKNLETTIADIVRATDGDGIYTDCVLGLKTCSEKNPCPVHHEYKEIKQKLIHLIESNSIGDFKEKLDLGLAFLKNK